MRRVFGPRTAIEAAFLVAVPVGSLEAGLGPYAIVAASAIGYLAVLLVEALLWRRGAPADAATSAPARVEPVSEPLPEPEPELEPEPEPEPEPELEPAAAEPVVVVPIGVGASPRSWNLWDLERLSRESAGQDAVRDEERTFLLMYLREFAGPDGLLPDDFDSLVRDSFGDLVGAR